MNSNFTYICSKHLIAFSVVIIIMYSDNSIIELNITQNMEHCSHEF